MRAATIADIVRRLTDTGCTETVITALGWGMGDAQYGITDAVNAAEAAGLVVTRTRGGKRFARLAAAPLTVGQFTIGLIRLSEGARYAWGVDVHRPATEDDEHVFDIPVGSPVLADQIGAHDLDQAVTDYLGLIAEYTARAEPAALAA